MSYSSRVYRQRNAHIPDESKKEPFFAKQNEGDNTFVKNSFFTAKQKQEVDSQPENIGTSATPASCGIPAECPSAFCTPFPSKILAEQARNSLGAGLLAGIAAFVSPRVVPLWADYLSGGTAPQNLSSQFGSDFTSSLTTKEATRKLIAHIQAELTASPPVFPPGLNVVVLNISSLIPGPIADLDTEGSSLEMNFNVIDEVPGNIAGGIGKTQLSCPVGAKPSPFDDSRGAEGTVIVIKNAAGDLTVIPLINYTVKDTVDLCPGNCGALKEQAATVPMSMMEASGVTGDVPFQVDFPAPQPEAAPFNIPAPAPPPAPRLPARVKVRASPHLRIREQPNTTAAILGNYPNGTEIVINCIVNGQDVSGNTRWGKTDRGFVSDFHLIHLDSNSPADC